MSCSLVAFKSYFFFHLQVKTWFANRRNREKVNESRRKKSQPTAASKPKPVIVAKAATSAKKQPPKQRKRSANSGVVVPTPAATAAVPPLSSPVTVTATVRNVDQSTVISLISREMYCGGGATIAPAKTGADQKQMPAGDDVAASAAHWLCAFNQERIKSQLLQVSDGVGRLSEALLPAVGTEMKPLTVTGKELDLSFLPAVSVHNPSAEQQSLARFLYPSKETLILRCNFNLI